MKKLIIYILITASGSILFSQDTLQEKIFNAKNKVLPALVHVEPVKEVFSSGKRVKMQVTGSGVIFSKDGLVLTNNHVAEKARQVKCTLSNREELPAEVIGLDALTDLAVLKLDLQASSLDSIAYVNFGNSDSLQVGEIVLALGSPLGLSRSLSMGVISSIDRYFEDSGNMVSPFNLWIQTDAAINPGNSGGPLVNLHGEVIGINARSIFFGENLGFAIPINTAELVIDRILRDRKVERSWIGVDWQEIKEYRKYIGKKNLEGALIAYLEPNSPGAKSGLQPGDLVYAVNGEKITAVYKEELPKIRKLISEFEVGEKIQITYLRNGKEEKTILTTEDRGKFEGSEFECESWGLSVKELTPRIIKNLNLKNNKGVLVSGVRSGSNADEADVFRGNVIQYVDDVEITDLDIFRKVYGQRIDIPERGIMLKLYFRNSIRFALLQGK